MKKKQNGLFSRLIEHGERLEKFQKVQKGF